MTAADDKRRNALIEQVTSAWRPRRPDGAIEGHPAWFDLDEDGRRAAFEATWQIRQIEAALDEGALSSTGRVVMGRIEGRR